MKNVLNVEQCTLNSLRQTTRAVAKLYDSALQEVDLKSTQFSLLATLQQCKEITLTELADILIMDRTTLTRNLKPLTIKGFINIKTSSSDKRFRTLSLTEDGQKILATALPLWKKSQQTIVDSIGVTQWHQLGTDLSSLRNKVR